MLKIYEIPTPLTLKIYSKNTVLCVTALVTLKKFSNTHV